MARAPRPPTVGDIMNPAPVTVRPDAKVTRLLQLFQADRPEAVAVVDAEGYLCGIVTMLDLLRASRPDERMRLPGPEELLSRTVETIMRPGVITLEPADPVPVVVDLMVETRFHALPVVHRQAGGPRLVGMVEQQDLLGTLVGA